MSAAAVTTAAAIAESSSIDAPLLAIRHDHYLQNHHHQHHRPTSARVVTPPRPSARPSTAPSTSRHSSGPASTAAAAATTMAAVAASPRGPDWATLPPRTITLSSAPTTSFGLKTRPRSSPGARTGDATTSSPPAVAFPYTVLDALQRSGMDHVPRHGIQHYVREHRLRAYSSSSTASPSAATGPCTPGPLLRRPASASAAASTTRISGASAGISAAAPAPQADRDVVDAARLFQITEAFMREHDLMPPDDDGDGLFDDAGAKRRWKLTEDQAARIRAWLVSDAPLQRGATAEDELHSLYALAGSARGLHQRHNPQHRGNPRLVVSVSVSHAEPDHVPSVFVDAAEAGAGTPNPHAELVEAAAEGGGKGGPSARVTEDAGALHDMFMRRVRSCIRLSSSSSRPSSASSAGRSSQQLLQARLASTAPPTLTASRSSSFSASTPSSFAFASSRRTSAAAADRPPRPVSAPQPRRFAPGEQRRPSTPTAAGKAKSTVSHRPRSAPVAKTPTGPETSPYAASHRRHHIAREHARQLHHQPDRHHHPEAARRASTTAATTGGPALAAATAASGRAVHTPTRVTLTPADRAAVVRTYFRRKILHAAPADDTSHYRLVADAAAAEVAAAAVAAAAVAAAATAAAAAPGKPAAPGSAPTAAAPAFSVDAFIRAHVHAANAAEAKAESKMIAAQAAEAEAAAAAAAAAVATGDAEADADGIDALPAQHHNRRLSAAAGGPPANTTTTTALERRTSLALAILLADDLRPAAAAATSATSAAVAHPPASPLAPQQRPHPTPAAAAVLAAFHRSIRKPPVDRTLLDVKRIFAVLRPLRGFRSFSDFLLGQICSVAAAVAIEGDRAVFKQGKNHRPSSPPEKKYPTRLGDPPTCWFVLLAGAAAVHVSPTGDPADSKLVARLNPGDSFGDVALYADAQRGASIITTEPCVLVKIEKTDYLRIIRFVHEKQNLHAYNAIKKAPLLAGWSPASIRAVLVKMREDVFERGQTIFSEEKRN
ncbi:hypothetical protein DFJ73DRAFT_905398 [Zopfochytrium polystomum]|nr:hypothetical protein DFJ73DRAFT_905398 [Zopfochytrium polystomum]